MASTFYRKKVKTYAEMVPELSLKFEMICFRETYSTEWKPLKLKVVFFKQMHMSNRQEVDKMYISN